MPHCGCCPLIDNQKKYVGAVRLKMTVYPALDVHCKLTWTCVYVCNVIFTSICKSLTDTKPQFSLVWFELEILLFKVIYRFWILRISSQIKPNFTPSVKKFDFKIGIFFWKQKCSVALLTIVRKWFP